MARKISRRAPLATYSTKDIPDWLKPTRTFLVPHTDDYGVTTYKRVVVLAETLKATETA